MPDPTKPTPLSSFVIKVASRCNLNCSYCYEYNMGDTSWKRMPKVMSEEVFTKILLRIREHCESHNFHNISLSLHGGEPLLVGHENMNGYAELIDRYLGAFQVSTGIQTNGLLIDQEFIEIFQRYGITLGLSLDGLPGNNDIFRYYHNGKGSGKDVENKLSLIKDTGLFAGILSVIHVDADPVKTWRYLASFDPPVIDFLFPHAHWGNARTTEQLDRIARHGDWLCAIFDDWYGGYQQEIRIRFFEEILYRLFGHPGSLESLGLEEVTLVTVGVNGDYEQVDTMKSVFPGAHTTSLNIFDHTLDDLLNHQNVIARQSGISGLSDQCKQCQLVSICGGGYYPHRYSEDNYFNNPSVYCAALIKIISHINQRVDNDLKRKKYDAF